MKITGIILLSIGLLSLFGGLIHPSGAMLEVVITGYVLKILLIIGGLFLINKERAKDESSNVISHDSNSIKLKERYPELLKYFTLMSELTNDANEFIFSHRSSFPSNGKEGLFTYNFHLNANNLILSCTFQDEENRISVSSEEIISNNEVAVEPSKIKWNDHIENLRLKLSNLYISKLSKNVMFEISKRNLIVLKASIEKKLIELSDSREKERIRIQNFQEYLKPFKEKKIFDSAEDEKLFALNFERFKMETEEFNKRDDLLEKECSDLNAKISSLCIELNLPFEENR